MRQIFYISDSLLGADQYQLDRLMLQAMRRNGLIGITGLLWTDGVRFAQILEGDEANVDATLLRIYDDVRHANVRMVRAETVERRHFGGWAMYRPASDPLGARLDASALNKLTNMKTAAAAAFVSVVSNAIAPAGT